MTAAATLSMTTPTFAAIAAGGAAGAMARFGLAGLIEAKCRLFAARICGAGQMAGLEPVALPIGIFAVNVIGSVLLGFIGVMITLKWPEAVLWRAAICIGFLGAFTTFSTFSQDAVALLSRGVYGLAAVYIFGSVVACIGGFMIGALAARAVAG